MVYDFKFQIANCKFRGGMSGYRSAVLSGCRNIRYSEEDDGGLTSGSKGAVSE